MKKLELIHRTETVVSETKAALQTVYDSLNNGQKSKLIRIDEVKALFDRYGVDY